MAGLLGGCARYEYRLVQPTASAQIIPKGAGITLQMDPLEYKVADRGHRVAMRIINPTDAAIRIIPQRSWVVDPRGHSHPIRPSMIAPHSFVDASLPPIPMAYSGTAYPTFGFGGYPYSGFYWAMEYSYAPWSYSYQVVTPYDWAWREGQARLHLGFGRDNQEFDQDFVIERQKAR